MNNPADDLLRISMSHGLPRCLHAVAELGIAVLDIQMLTLLSGKERTEKEYSAMLRIAGFRLDRVIDVGMSTSILESVAI